MVDPADWLGRRPLRRAADIYGARHVTVVDRLSRTTVWSVTVAPSLSGLPARDSHESAHAHVLEDSPPWFARTAEEVFDTVHAAELLSAAPERTGAWFEVILVSQDHYHILRPFGRPSDGLVIELVLDARTANLAAARQEFGELLDSYGGADASPATIAIDPAPTRDGPSDPTGLPRRASGRPAGAGPGEPAAPRVEEGILHRVIAALRAMT